MRSQPGGRRQPNTTLLLGVHHLDSLSERATRLRLHLAEHHPTAAPHDEIELEVIPTAVPRLLPEETIRTR